MLFIMLLDHLWWSISIFFNALKFWFVNIFINIMDGFFIGHFLWREGWIFWPCLYGWMDGFFIGHFLWMDGWIFYWPCFYGWMDVFFMDGWMDQLRKLQQLSLAASPTSVATTSWQTFLWRVFKNIFSYFLL